MNANKLQTTEIIDWRPAGVTFVILQVHWGVKDPPQGFYDMKKAKSTNTKPRKSKKHQTRNWKKQKARID